MAIPNYMQNCLSIVKPESQRIQADIEEIDTFFVTIHRTWQKLSLYTYVMIANVEFQEDRIVRTSQLYELTDNHDIIIKITSHEYYRTVISKGA